MFYFIPGANITQLLSNDFFHLMENRNAGTMAGCKVGWVFFEAISDFCDFGGVDLRKPGTLHKMEAADYKVRKKVRAELSLKCFHHIQNAVVRTAAEKYFLSASCQKQILFMMEFVLNILAVAKLPKTLICRRQRPGTLFNSKKLKLIISLRITFQKPNLRQRENLFVNPDIAVALIFSIKCIVFPACIVLACKSWSLDSIPQRAGFHPNDHNGRATF